MAAQGGSTNGRENSEDYCDTVIILIKSGADVNAVAKYGGIPPAMTPYDDAAKVENKAVVEILKQYGGVPAVELRDK